MGWFRIDANEFQSAMAFGVHLLSIVMKGRENYF
jgi:hypothetical protein